MSGVENDIYIDVCVLLYHREAGSTSRYEYTFGLSSGFQLFDPAFVRSKLSCESRVSG